MLVMFTVLLTSLIGFAIAENEAPVPTLYSAGQGEGPNCLSGPCPDGYICEGEGGVCLPNNANHTIVGASCGTVSPGYQNQCCISKGYAGWDAENFTCIGEKLEKPKEGRVVGGMLGTPRESPKPWDNASNNSKLGSGCGTVTPVYRNDCCQSKGYVLWNTEKHQCTNDTNNGNNESVVCPMDAKLCQDGSYVSRVGPHCEFAPCPKQVNISKEKICCAIYGYGVNMTSTNINYKIIAKKECSIPEGFVGGNREIVNNSYCIEEIKTERQDFIDKKWEIMQDKNRIKNNYTNQSECPDNCTCVGSAMKCELENGSRTMTIIAGKSGNVIFQIKDTNASTNVTLYKADGKVYGVFRDNDTHQIILPDEVKDRIKEMMKDKRGRISNLTDENITLNDTGSYNVEGKKKARLFWIIPVKEKVQFDVNSETGEITKTKTKWWGFLARDVKEQDNSTTAQ